MVATQRGVAANSWDRMMSAPASGADFAAQGRRFAARYATPAGRDAARLRAFEAARRHSRLVRILRVATPSVVVLAVLTLTLGAIFDPFRTKAVDLSFSDLSVAGAKITMGRPKLTGVRRDGRAYTVNADKAIQDVKRPNFVELRGIDGDLGMADNTTLHIAAAVGFYDNGKQTLDLSQDVRIHSSSYDVRLASAHIDFKASSFQSDDPVNVVTASGATIAADSALARDNGEELTFSGHVRSTFAPESTAASAPAEIKGTNP
jgi:lipopolysaccharide export system protein LptC